MFSGERVYSESLYVEEIFGNTVDDFFSRLNGFAQSSDLDLLAKEEISEFFSSSERRDSHLLRALADPSNYSRVVADILDTAYQLSEIGSNASKEMLIDWITAAPELCLERLALWKAVEYESSWDADKLSVGIPSFYLCRERNLT